MGEVIACHSERGGSCGGWVGGHCVGRYREKTDRAPVGCWGMVMKKALDSDSDSDSDSAGRVC